MTFFDEDDYGFYSYGFSERFVHPHETRSRHRYPYSYSPYYLWGTPGEGDTAVYSDRLSQWDRDKYEAAKSKVNKRFDQMNEADASKFMSAYFGNKVTVTALAEGCNVSNGYPYWIIWFKEN